MYRYKALDKIVIQLDDVITDPNDRDIPFSLYVLLKVCKSFVVIVRDYYLQKGL